MIAVGSLELYDTPILRKITSRNCNKLISYIIQQYAPVYTCSIGYKTYNSQNYIIFDMQLIITIRYFQLKPPAVSLEKPPPPPPISPELNPPPEFAVENPP